jgi:hypothetical protein
LSCCNDFDRNVVGCWIEKLDIPQNHPIGLSVEWIANSFGYQDDELRFLTDEESIIRQIKLYAKLLKDNEYVNFTDNLPTKVG